MIVSFVYFFLSFSSFLHFQVTAVINPGTVVNGLFTCQLRSMADGQHSAQGERVLPVFVLNNQLPAFQTKFFTTSEIYAAAEKTCGYDSIEGAQKIGALWRIYPSKQEARQKLLIQGFVLRGVRVEVKAKNPFVVKSSGENDVDSDQQQSTKLIIGNVPLSFSDEELLQAVKGLGVTMHSKLIPERDRDENGKLTRWKTGRRFVYIKVPSTPLPKTVPIGLFKTSLYHREQKLATQQQQAECQRCLTKGHSTSECTNPVRCKQCYQSEHRAGDVQCCLTPENTQDLPTSPTDCSEQSKESVGVPSTQAGEQTQTKEQEKAEKSVSSRGRPRIKNRQTTLSSYRRDNSGSAKRPRSKDSPPSQSDKQPRVDDPCTEEMDDESLHQLPGEGND